MLSRFRLSQVSATPWTVAPPGSSVHEILQARRLEWGAISSCRGSSPPWEAPKCDFITFKNCELHCCTAETNLTLSVNCTAIKKDGGPLEGPPPDPESLEQSRD